MVHDRLSLKLSLLEKAGNDIRVYNRLYALVEEEAKSLPAVMDSKEYIQAVVDGAGKIVKEMVADIECNKTSTDSETESLATGLAALSTADIAKEEEAAK